MFYVYGLRLKGSNGYRYVGSSNAPKKRLHQHKSGDEHNLPKHEWVTDNREDIVMDILEGVTDSDHRAVEQKWISKLANEGHDLLNIRRADGDSAFSRLPEEDKVKVITQYLDAIEGDSQTPWLD